MVSHKYYHLSGNEGFVIFFTSKLITCFIDGFTSKVKSKSIAYLLSESEQIYWMLDLEDEVYLIWIIWTNGLQECKGNFIFQSEAERTTTFGQDLKKIRFVLRGMSGGAG